MEDKVIEAVCADLRQRSAVGIKKYGITLERKDLSLDQWLEHAYQEALDMANYLKRSLMELRDRPATDASSDLLEALKRCRYQWIDSVNAAACLAAIEKAEGRS